VEIREIASFTFFDPKKVVQSRARELNRKIASNIQNCFPKMPKSKTAKRCLKNVFYTLSFVMSGRFGDRCM